MEKYLCGLYLCHMSPPLSLSLSGSTHHIPNISFSRFPSPWTVDSCIAIHPTGAEELVTMGAWGTSPQATGAKDRPLNGATAAEPTLKTKI